MKCPKCGAEVPSEAVMCPKCGSFTGKPEQPAAAAQPKRKVKTAWIAAAVLGAVIIIAIILLLLLPGKPITQAPPPKLGPAPAITNATAPPPTAGPAITNAAPPPTAPPPPGTPAVKKPAPPQEVVDYLNFVKDIEAQRQTLLKDTERAVTMAAGASQAQSMLDAIAMSMDDSGTNTRPKQATNVESELDHHINNWAALVRRFDSKPAPSQCSQFAGNYRAVLGNEVQGMIAVNSIFKTVDWSNLDSIKTTIARLQKMKDDPNLQGSIDKAVDASDTKLTELCSNYDMQKPFTVEHEQKQSSIIAPGM